MGTLGLVDYDIVVFSGSLNTLPPRLFYPTLQRAFDAATHTLIFNFLCDTSLAAGKHLHWHHRNDVEAFVRTLSSEYRTSDAYLPGDCTIRVDKRIEE